MISNFEIRLYLLLWLLGKITDDKIFFILALTYLIVAWCRRL